MTDDIAAELCAADAAGETAVENLAKIRAQVEQRADATVEEDVFTALFAAVGKPAQASPELYVRTGSSFLRITAGTDHYLIGGTDNGYDWVHPRPHPPSSDDTVTVDMGGEQDVVVGAAVMDHLLSHAACTSYSYNRVEGGRNGHELLHYYVDNWINAHAEQHDSTPQAQTGFLPEMALPCANNTRQATAVPAPRRDVQEDLAALAHGLGVDAKALDETIHDAALVAASEVNNGGLGSQIGYLVQQFGPDETEQKIRDAAPPPVDRA